MRNFFLLTQTLILLLNWRRVRREMCAKYNTVVTNLNRLIASFPKMSTTHHRRPATEPDNPFSRLVAQSYDRYINISTA